MIENIDNKLKQQYDTEKKNRIREYESLLKSTQEE